MEFTFSILPSQTHAMYSLECVCNSLSIIGIPVSASLPSALAQGSEWGIYFSLYKYVHTCVRTWYVSMYRNMSRSGMLIGMLRVSCRPIEFYLLLDAARTTTLRNRSVDEHVVLQGL